MPTPNKCQKWHAAVMLVVLFSINAACAARQPQLQSHGYVTNDPVSLREMVATSSIIVYGRIVSIKETKDSYRVVVHGWDLKTGGKADAFFNLNFDPTFSPEVTEDERVLWFLGDNDYSGNTLPIGVHSGDFRIAGTWHGGIFARNMRGNDGLWSNSQSLWSSSEERQAALSHLRDIVDSAPRVTAIMKYGDEPSKAQEVPVDLIFSFVHAVLNTRP